MRALPQDKQQEEEEAYRGGPGPTGGKRKKRPLYLCIRTCLFMC